MVAGSSTTTVRPDEAHEPAQGAGNSPPTSVAAPGQSAACAPLGALVGQKRVSPEQEGYPYRLGRLAMAARLYFVLGGTDVDRHELIRLVNAELDGYPPIPLSALRAE